MMVSEGEMVFFDCNSNETNNNNNMSNDAGVDNTICDTDLWPLEEDPNNNNNAVPEMDSPPDLPRHQEVVSSDDLLFDTAFLESLISGSGGRLDDNVAFLKTTHVTGHGVSCEVVSGEFR